MTWLTGWNRRKPITVTGSTSGAQSDYQMKLIVNQASGTDSAGIVNLGGNVLTTFNDLRFTKSDGNTILNYWIESITGTTPNQTATVWIKLAPYPDTIPYPGTYNFYIYYSNSSASIGSNGINTFAFFDDFSGTLLDTTNRWTEEVIVDNGIPHTFSEDSGYWKLKAWDNGGCADFFYRNVSKLLVPNNQSVRMCYTLKSTGRDYGIGISSKMANGTYLGITGYNGAPANRVSYPFTVPSLNTPHYFDLYGYGTSIGVYHDNSLKHSYDISGYVNTDWSFFLFFGFTKCLNSGTTSEIWWDYTFVRKYASPEPTSPTAGTEETILGDLNISSTPSGATGASIYIDGNPSSSGVTPLIVTGFSPGTHTYRLTKTGYTEIPATNFTINSGQTTTISQAMLTVANITTTNMVITRSEIPCRVGICSVTIDITWTNSGETTGIITPNPNIKIDNVSQTPFGETSIPANSSVTKRWTISGMNIATHTICPDPN